MFNNKPEIDPRYIKEMLEKFHNEHIEIINKIHVLEENQHKIGDEIHLLSYQLTKVLEKIEKIHASLDEKVK